MTKIYQYNSTGFGCLVEVAYNKGLLVSVAIHAPQQNTSNVIAHFYTQEIDFIASCQKHKIKYVELQHQVTFEMFWNRYDYKQSGIKPAEKAWSKLEPHERQAAYDYIPAYNGFIKNNNTAKKYGSSYLNSKIYL